MNLLTIQRCGLVATAPLNRLQFLTIRKYLSVVFAAPVALLLTVSLCL
jgi:hypothetical protein